MTHGKPLRSQIGLALFLVVVSCALGFARDAKLPYVLLLDVSGSMEREGAVRYARYSSGQVSGIAQHLGRAIASADNAASIYVQPFSSSHDSFELRGPVSVSEIQSAVPNTARAQETELDAALQLGMQGRTDSYLFILTDNRNDFAGSRSDQRFYDLLAKSPSIHTVFFVPLAQPGDKAALVLYAVACGKAHRSVLRQVVSEFAKAMQSEPVQFRGFYDDDKEQESLNFGQHVMRTDETGEESPAIIEGDAIIIPYNEGRSIDGALKFRIHSNLKHWRIKDGELRKLEVLVEVPSGYGSVGEYKLPISVTGGRKMNVAPGGDSAEVYTLPLSKISDVGVSLVRANLFKTRLPEITATVHISAVVHVSENPADSGIRPEFNETLKRRIEAVQKLPEIMNLMTFQPDTASTAAAMERVIPVNRAILIRVTPNPLKNLLVRLIQYGLPALLLAATALLVFSGRGKIYTVTEPGERSRILKFSLLNRDAALLWNGRKVAMMQVSGGRFVIHPEAGFSAAPATAVGNPVRFEICNLKSGDKGSYQVRSGSTPPNDFAQRRHL